MAKGDLHSFSDAVCGEALSRFMDESSVLQCSLELLNRYRERSRFYHGANHVLDMVERILANESGDRRDILLTAALYHDAVYYPGELDNEERSAKLFEKWSAGAPGSDRDQVARIIRDSKYTERLEGLSADFMRYDTRLLREGDYEELLDYEMAIFKENQFLPFAVYREKRLEFLARFQERFPELTAAPRTVEILRGFQPRIAVYAGSFNPFHIGHLDILRRAEVTFDKVIVAVGVNPEKAVGNRNAFDELKSVLRFHQVDYFEGLITDYLTDAIYAGPLRMVRGLRDGHDLEKEMAQFRFIQDLDPRVEVVFVPTSREYAHLSSSSIRELAKVNAEKARAYLVTPEIAYDLVDAPSAGKMSKGEA